MEKNVEFFTKYIILKLICIIPLYFTITLLSDAFSCLLHITFVHLYKCNMNHLHSDIMFVSLLIKGLICLKDVT